MGWQGIKNRWQSAWEDGTKVAKKLPEDVRLELEPTINYLSRLGKFEIVLELIADHRKHYNDQWLIEQESAATFAIATRQTKDPDEQLAPLIEKIEAFWPDDAEPAEEPDSQLPTRTQPIQVFHRSPTSLDCDDEPPETVDNDALEGESEWIEDVESVSETSQEPTELESEELELDEPEFIPADHHRRDDERIVDIDLEPVLDEGQFTEVDEPESGWTADFDPDLEDFLLDSELVEKEDIEPTNKLTREIKARQIAAEVIARHDWPIKSLPLLSEIFTRSGYGATRVALERLMDQGLTLEELILATHIKALWSNCPAYWICYSRAGDGHDTQYLLSWPAALSILNAFASLPCLEEIEAFLDEQFDYWSSKPSLRRNFKSFRMYIWFRTARLDATLCPTEWQNFDSDPYVSWS